MKIPWIFHKDYDIPLPKNHRFSSSKFGDLYTLLIDSELAKSAEVFVPNAAEDSQLTEVHTRDYISKIKNGNLSNKEEKILGLPWSETLSKRSYLAVNGTYLAAKLALINGIACHLAGGTHHAHANYGSGFCVYNDLAYAAKNIISDGKCKKVLIIDCDVHQGDGTAEICKNDTNIFIQGDLTSKSYADITLDIMQTFGIKVENDSYKKFSIRSGQVYTSRTYEIEGDWSSVAFWMQTACLANKCDIKLKGIQKESIQGDKEVINIFFIKSPFTVLFDFSFSKTSKTAL